MPAAPKVGGRVLLNFWERRGPPMLKLPTTTLLTNLTGGNNKGKVVRVEFVTSAHTKNRGRVLKFW
jgi:hypothetical protein